jgi:hypothetical protein
MKNIIAKLASIEQKLLKIASKWTVKDMNYDETHRGIAWDCKILKDGKVVGHCENRGYGGANSYRFTDKEAEKEFHELANKKYRHVAEPEAELMEELIKPLEDKLKNSL